jgi:DNA-binding LacI/PurR family transcriptional regulator
MGNMIELNREIPVPLFYQLKERIKNNLKESFKPGDKFYSERQLAKMLSIARGTASRVMNDLVQENILYRLHGKGTFVADFSSKEKFNNIGFMVSSRLKSSKTLSHEADYSRLVYIEDICAKYAYNVLFMSERTTSQGKENLKNLIEKIDGIILLGDMDIELVNFLNEKIPTVVMDDCPENCTVDCVVGDNLEGAFNNVNYLIELSHNRIGIIYGALSASSFRDRLAGYKKALASNGIEYSDELIVEGGSRLEDGYNAMEKLLSLKNPPTAVFGSNDTMAIGAMKKINEAGLKVPDDISITGFDDIDSASFTNPPLTTTRFNKMMLAEKSVDRLIGKINNKITAAPEVSVIPVELIKRNSCKKI